MAGDRPVIYLIHGDDELDISKKITVLEEKLGDPAMASLNITHLTGAALTLDALRLAANSMPVFCPRRLVVVKGARERFSQSDAREKFFALLQQVPESTALVLAEYSLLDEKKDWLLKWAVSAGKRVHVTACRQPRGGKMVEWILGQARAQGGQFSNQAAALLATLVGEDTRTASQEIQKLLLYVNFSRPVETEDVHELTPDAGLVEDFALVNAIRERNQRKAMSILRRELAQKEVIVILHSIVSIFRRLLQARDVIERGGGKTDVARELKISPNYAHHLTEQARPFSLAVLSDIYHRLLEIDEAIKTGKMDGEVALDLFITEFTSQR